MAKAEAAAPLPTIAQLGTDLLTTTPGQRRRTLGRPFVALGMYGAAVWFGWWLLTPILVFGVFVTVVTATHDVVHRSLGLGRRATEWWLFVLGAFVLASGHSYRTTHHQHHRVFPGPDDPEGDPARMTFWQAVLHGPVFLPKLWWWSWKRATTPGPRRWLAAEAIMAPAAIIATLSLWVVGAGDIAVGIGAYSLMVINGSWVFPLLTVHLPHRNYGDSPMTQTHTVRDPFFPHLFLELTYHLEHHLYPQVPTHHLAELAARLEPVLKSNNVRPQRLFFRRHSDA